MKDAVRQPSSTQGPNPSDLFPPDKYGGGERPFQSLFLLVCDAVKIPECFIRHDPRIQKGDSASVNPDPKRIPGLILQQVGNKMIGASRYNIDRFHRIILSVNALKKSAAAESRLSFIRKPYPSAPFISEMAFLRSFSL